MRRALLIFMIAMLPFQWVWAAAATICQHEACASTTHFGHHVHEHDAGKAAGSGGGEQGLPGGDDADCRVCQLSAAKTCGGSSVPVAAAATPCRGISATPLFDSHIPCGLERPDRIATP